MSGWVSTGASLTGTTVTGLAAVLLAASPSLTVKLTVRVAAVGLSLVVEYWTDRSTVCQLAIVVVPVRSSTPGAALVSVIPPAGVKVRVSPVTRPAVIDTVPDTRLVSSTSVTVRPPSTVTAAPFSVKVGVEPDRVIVGASLTQVTVTDTVAVEPPGVEGVGERVRGVPRRRVAVVRVRLVGEAGAAAGDHHGAVGRLGAPSDA